MDIGTAFGGMGSSREMMIASLAEPAMLMAIFTVSLVSRSTSLFSDSPCDYQQRIHLKAVHSLCSIGIYSYCYSRDREDTC